MFRRNTATEKVGREMSDRRQSMSSPLPQRPFPFANPPHPGPTDGEASHPPDDGSEEFLDGAGFAAVTEDSPPFVISLVVGDDNGSAFVAAGHQTEHQD